jgi:uncharacterized protein (TIGR03084 family)
LPTPSPRWTVAHQIAHLTYFDQAAAVAIENPDAFAGMAADLSKAAGGGHEAVDDFTLASYLDLPPPDLLDSWRQGRATLAGAAAQLTDDSRIAWYGPPMGAKSFLSARLMEAWAHGQDIVDTVGAARPASDRLRHIAQLGFITRGWSYINRGLAVPDAPVRMDLMAPSGDVWAFGPEEAAEMVAGTALDFCLVVTQRRHLDDTGLEVSSLAREWLRVAQAFAGPPTDGPAPGARREKD